MNVLKKKQLVTKFKSIRIEPKDKDPIKNHRNQNNHPHHNKEIHCYF